VGHARECGIARGRSNSKISVWGNGTSTRTSNDERRLSPKDPNFLGKRCGGLEPGHLENTVLEGTILIRISFR